MGLGINKVKQGRYRTKRKRSGKVQTGSVPAKEKLDEIGSRANLSPRPVFLNHRAAAGYRALASIIPGRERFSWNLSF